jgi:hypothetical protein
MTYKQSPKCELVNEMIMNWYDNLTYSEQQDILRMTNPIMNACDHMTREGAIEVLVKTALTQMDK